MDIFLYKKKFLMNDLFNCFFLYKFVDIKIVFDK